MEIGYIIEKIFILNILFQKNQNIIHIQYQVIQILLHYSYFLQIMIIQMKRYKKKMKKYYIKIRL